MGDTNISSTITGVQRNQQQSNHALQRQESSSKPTYWSNESTRTPPVKATPSTLRSQGTTPSLFSFAPSFQTNAQKHPSTPLSTAVQMVPASASTQLEKSSISKKRHDRTGLSRVKKEMPSYSSLKFKTVSFAMVSIIHASTLLSRALINGNLSCMHDPKSPLPANGLIKKEFSTTPPCAPAKSTNDDSRVSSAYPSSTAFISDPVLMASPTTPLLTTDHVPQPMTDITNTISLESNGHPSSNTPSATYARQSSRRKNSNVNGDRKKEATTTTTTSNNNTSNQLLHVQDVDKFAAFLKQTLAEKDAARAAAVEEINTLRGRVQAQEKIIAEYKSQCQHLDQVSTSLSSKQDDMGQG